MNTIVAYRHAESLFTPTTAWDALAGGIPFRETAWLESWWNQFGDQGEFLFVTVLDENDALSGILPLRRHGQRGWETIASGAACTDHVSLLARPEDRDKVAETIADFLIENAIDPQLGWDRLVFDGTLAGDPGMQTLIEQLRKRDARVRLSTRTNLWFIACQDSWESYLRACSRRTRHRYRDMIRQIDEPGEGTPTRELAVRIPDRADSVATALDKLIEMHQRHWRSQGEPGSYAHPGMREFVHSAALKSLARQSLFMPTLVRCCPRTRTEQIIAAQLYFVGADRRLYCYSTGVDYDYAALSPGSLLNVFVLKYAHENGYSGIDFMRGDETYKKRLGGQPIPLLQMDVTAPTRRGRIAALIDDCNFHGKQFLRRRLGRSPVQTLTCEAAFDPKYREHLPTTIHSAAEHDDELDWVEDDCLPVILPISLAMTSS